MDSKAPLINKLQSSMFRAAARRIQDAPRWKLGPPWDSTRQVDLTYHQSDCCEFTILVDFQTLAKRETKLHKRWTVQSQHYYSSITHVRVQRGKTLQIDYSVVLSSCLILISEDLISRDFFVERLSLSNRLYALSYQSTSWILMGSVGILRGVGCSNSTKSQNDTYPASRILRQVGPLFQRETPRHPMVFPSSPIMPTLRGESKAIRLVSMRLRQLLRGVFKQFPDARKGNDQ